MTRSVSSLGLLVTGWGMLGFALVQVLPSTEMTLVLGTIVFAECLSTAITTRSCFQSETTSQPNQDALARMLSCWVILCFLLIPLFQFQRLPFYQGQPTAVLSFLALTLILALLKFNAQGRPAAVFLVSLRLVLAAAAFLAVNSIGGTGIEVFLSSLMFSHLVILLGVVLFSRKDLANDCHSETDTPLDVFCRYADLFILPMVLGGADALLYLVARCLSIAISSGLSQLGGRAMPALITGLQLGSNLQFITMAARLNLGFLLVGGSIAIAVVAVGPYVASFLQLDEDRFQTILLWLVLGASAPVLFGATEILLGATNKHDINLLSNVAGCIILVSAVFVAPHPTALFMAKCFAGTQLAISATCAVILARYAGVWPGLTALLLRQIKLF